MRRLRPVRRVVFAGHPLPPGRHEVALPVPVLGVELAAVVLVGARRGPRAFVVGGLDPGDAAAVAIVRGVLAAVDPEELGGSIVALARANPLETPLGPVFAGPTDGAPARIARAVLRAATEKAAFGLEVRSGPAGRPTLPHVRADLRDERVARLARAFGVEVVVDALGARGSLRRASTRAGVPAVRYEGGELGRQEPLFVARGVDGVLNLLRARRMLPGAAARPTWRATVSDTLWLKAPRAGWPVPQVAVGALVSVGDVIARLYDAAGRELAVVPAPARAVVLAVAARARAAAKSPLVLLGRVRASTRARTVAQRAERARHRVGWSEWVTLPDLGIPRLHAKIDTGARTSALHVRGMKQVGEMNGRPVLELRLPVGHATTRVEVVEHVVVRDSGGHAETRPVIETTLVLGPVQRRVRITLTDRGDMLFPMLVGRTALGDDFIIDAAARHLLEVD